MCLLNRNVCAGCGQASKKMKLGTEWPRWNEANGHPTHTPPALRLQSSPQKHLLDLARGDSGLQASPSLLTKSISLNSLDVPLFLVIKDPGNTALPNSGKPQRQKLLFFKDVLPNNF